VTALPVEHQIGADATADHARGTRRPPAERVTCTGSSPVGHRRRTLQDHGTTEGALDVCTGRDVLEVDAVRVRRVAGADVTVSPAPTRAEAPEVVLEVALRLGDRVPLVARVVVPSPGTDVEVGPAPIPLVEVVPGADWAAAAACAAAASALVRALASSSTNDAGVW
jgi:hypothetical protein